jgi:hypothetical protein
MVYFAPRAENEVLPARDRVSSSRRIRELETIKSGRKGRGVNAIFHHTKQ